MTLRAETILSTLYSQLQSLVPNTVAGVSRHYPYSFNDASLPAVQILMGSDKPTGDEIPTNLTFQDWDLEVFFDIIIKSTTLPLDTALNNIRLAIHKSIMNDYTLGLGSSFILNGYPSAVDAPEQRSEGETPVSVMRMGFIFRYRANIKDPSA